MGFIFLRNERLEIDNANPVSLHLPEWNIILKNCILGEGVNLWANLNLYGCTIGSGVKLASFIEIRSGVAIGEKTKIEPFVFIPEGVSIARHVFIGPNVTFTNDLYPRSCHEDGSQITDYTITPTIVEEGASIGAGSVIRCGITIGKRAMIGAGSVVTKDVGAGEVWYGEAAKRRKG